MFDFHHLNVFVNVVQQKSFSKAAEAIFLSQSTVSTHIQALEKALNIKLFDRMGKEIVLTPAGEKMYTWALDMLAMREKAIYDMKAHYSKIEGTVKVGTSTVPGQYILPDLIGIFRIKYPQALFRVTQTSSEEVAKNVISGVVDLGFVGAKFYQDKLNYYSIASDKLILITPNDYDISPEEVTMEYILTQELVMRNPGSGTQQILNDALSKKGLSVENAKIVTYFDSTEAVKQAVKCGLGLAIVSERAVQDYVECGAIKAFEIKDIDLTRDFYLIYHKERTLSPVAEKFIELLKGEKFDEESVC